MLSSREVDLARQAMAFGEGPIPHNRFFYADRQPSQDGEPPCADPTRPITTIRGAVVHGLKVARQLGFPTANVPLNEQSVARGVYAVRSQLADGRIVNGVASVGCNPTIPKDAPVLEVWLFDFDEIIYGQPLATELLIFLRDELHFNSIEALQAQVFADAAQARRVLASLAA